MPNRNWRDPQPLEHTRLSPAAFDFAFLPNFKGFLLVGVIPLLWPAGSLAAVVISSVATIVSAGKVKAQILHKLVKKFREK